MTVQSASNAGSVVAAHPSPMSLGEQVTPETIMMYVQNRLSAMDAQINLLLENQQKGDAIRRVLGKLQTAKAALGQEGGSMNKEQRDAARAAFAELKALDPTMAAALQKDLRDGGCYEANSNGKGGTELRDDYDANQAAAFDSAVSARTTELNKEAEKDMMNLTALISQRGMIVTTASSIQAAYNKTLEGQVNNLRG